MNQLELHQARICGTLFVPGSSERVVSIAGRIPDTLKVVRDMCLYVRYAYNQNGDPD